MSDSLKIMVKCDVCETSFQFGRHIYDGKFIPTYQIQVCSGCYEANWDGWGPLAEPIILAHLEKKGLPVPRRNGKGWLPRD
jgi:hypothetical protein